MYFHSLVNLLSVTVITLFRKDNRFCELKNEKKFNVCSNLLNCINYVFIF